MLSDLAGLIPASRIKWRLPATGLIFQKLDFAAHMLQDPHGGYADLTIECVAKAREQEADGSVQRKKPSLLPPSTGITHPVVRLLRASLASQQIASAQSSGVTTVPNSERLA